MKQKRWIKTVIETARTEAPALPWARGTRRGEMIARRGTDKTPAKLRRA